MAKLTKTKTHPRRMTETANGKRKAAASGQTKKSTGQTAGTKTGGKKSSGSRLGTSKRRAPAGDREAACRRSAGSATVATKKKAAKPVASRKTVTKAKRVSPSTKVAAGPSASLQDPIQFPEERPLPKTRLSDKDLEAFKELLLQKRAELVSDVERLANEALNHDGIGGEEKSPMPIHMADLGTDNWEQEFTLGLLANERALVREIDDALERIEEKTYGVCVATRKRITKARLTAKPWAKYCIEYARAREEGTVP